MPASSVCRLLGKPKVAVWPGRDIKGFAVWRWDWEFGEADTNMPLWDGTRPDYDWAVAALVSEAGV
jgi:hypothetical protein